MGDRFYLQQLNALGTCPGFRSTTKRKRKMAWDDDKKAAVIAAYEEQDPTPENSMEIVKEIADEFDESPNGVRMILSKAGVYVKKTPAASSSSGGSASTGGSRVSKAAAQEALVAALNDIGADIDNDIVEKLTGKAAQYFAGVLSQAAETAQASS
tara:strand:+ start:1685 stop:2149 length:465 start_codon:yes stop_codon:yes gene_type:complete